MYILDHDLAPMCTESMTLQILAPKGSLVGAAGGLEFSSCISMNDARNGERDGDQRRDQHDDHNGARRQGCGKAYLSTWHVTARACAATHLLVRQVALNSACVFLPIMPPAMVSGMVMSAQINRIITMVPNGSAAVDCTQQFN